MTQCVGKTLENEPTEQERALLSMSLGTLDSNLLWSLLGELTGKL